MKVDLTDKFEDEEFREWFMTDTEAYDTDHNTKLCYAECIEPDEESEHGGVAVKLWFTVADMREQWGDDWDDAPYEEDAGEPYDSYVDENGTCNCYNIYTLTVELPINRDMLKMPCDYANHSLSACEINSGRAAWLYFVGSRGKCDGISVPAGIRVSEALELLKKVVNEKWQNRKALRKNTRV